MVSFWHGRPDRANYRRFRMKTVRTQDDFASMAETIQRRYSRLKREVKNRLPPQSGVPLSNPKTRQKIPRTIVSRQRAAQPNPRSVPGFRRFRWDRACPT